MVYLYEACDQISDFCHQQLLRKKTTKIILDGRKDGRTDRGKTVSPPPPSGSGGMIKREKFEDTKGVIKGVDNTTAKRKRTNNEI